MESENTEGFGAKINGPTKDSIYVCYKITNGNKLFRTVIYVAEIVASSDTTFHAVPLYTARHLLPLAPLVQ